MPRKPKQAKTVTVAWECWHCGGTHLWKWDIDLVSVQWPDLHLKCEHCLRDTHLSGLVRIGRTTWAGAW